MNSSSFNKYNIGGANYCSYPFVPFWNEEHPLEEEWKDLVKRAFNKSNEASGISLYIHLPFCESLCTFCSFKPYITVNHTVEDAYVDHLIKEWYLYLKIFKEKPSVREIYLGGGTPTFFSSENLKRLMRAIFETSNVRKDAEFCFEGHVNYTTPEHLFELHKLGFRKVSFGIQDFDRKVQESINRVQTYEAVHKITQSAKYHGYTSINFDVIYGLPFQTRKTLIDTIYKIRDLKPDTIAFYEYVHTPEKSPAQRSFEEYLPVEPEKNILLELGRKMLVDSGYYDVGMDFFSLKTDPLYRASSEKRIYRKYTGYTTAGSMLSIGLGVSAVSDTWYAVVQNVENTKDYYHAIDNKQLPLYKGYFLSKEDLIMRKHIEAIQSKFATSWENEEEQHPALYRTLERLKEFEKNKLIEIKSKELKIKKAGRAYLRAICTAMDERLWKNDENKKKRLKLKLETSKGYFSE